MDSLLHIEALSTCDIGSGPNSAKSLALQHLPSTLHNSQAALKWHLLQLPKRISRTLSSPAPTPPTAQPNNSPSASNKNHSSSAPPLLQPQTTDRADVLNASARKNTSSGTKNRDLFLRARSGNPASTISQRKNVNTLSSMAYTSCGWGICRMSWT